MIKRYSEEKIKRILKSSWCKTDKKFWDKVNKKVEDLPGEEWRTIKNWEMYMVSNFGRVKRTLQERYYPNGQIWLFSEKLLTPFIYTDGRPQVTLKQFGRRGTFYVYRLMMDAFEIPYESPDDIFVNHKNQNPFDNRLENLERASVKYNNNYGSRNQRVSKSRRKHFSKMTMEERANYMKPANEATRKKIECGGITFNSLSEFCCKYKLQAATASRWLNGVNAMPKKYQKMGLRYCD